MRVCQFRHFGKSDSDAALVVPPSRRVIFYSIARGERGGTGDVALHASLRCAYRKPAQEQPHPSTESLDKSVQEYDVVEIAMENSTKLPDDLTHNLRRLAHDLSNSIETILQAAYLLGQAKLDANSKKWAQLIDTAAQDAARINREIREILRSQS
jgi:signal transduction histidine kinase